MVPRMEKKRTLEKETLKSHHFWNSGAILWFCLKEDIKPFSPQRPSSIMSLLFSAEAPSKLAVSVPFRAVSDEIFVGPDS